MRIAVAVDSYSAAALPEALPARVRATQRALAKTFVREEAASLAAAGVEVELLVPLPERVGLLGLLAPQRDAEIVTRANEDGFTERFAFWPYHPLLRRAPLALLAARREARALGSLLDAAGPLDLLHAHFALPTGCAAARVAAARGLPYLVTVHESQLEATVRWPHLRRGIGRALAHAARVVAVSDFQRRRILDAFPALEPKTVVVPNGVDVSRFTPRANIRTEGDARISFVGNLVEVKNVPLLLEAARRLAAEGFAFKLAIAGDGPLRSALENAARDLGERARFTGPLGRKEAATLLGERTDVLVLPSRVETFGIVAIEALASGVPVVATRCGGPEETITNDVGRLVPPGDAGALARAIREVWEKRVGFPPARLADYARERYARERVAARLARLYEEVLREHG